MDGLLLLNLLTECCILLNSLLGDALLRRQLLDELTLIALSLNQSRLKCENRSEVAIDIILIIRATPITLIETIGKTHRSRIYLTRLASQLGNASWHITTRREHSLQLKVYVQRIAHTEGVYHTAHGSHTTRCVGIDIYDTHTRTRKELGIIDPILTVATNPVREVQHRIGVGENPVTLQAVVVRDVELTPDKLQAGTHDRVKPLRCTKLDLPADVARRFLVVAPLVPRHGIHTAA